jgi:Zn-dependent peptidase ImmA (M78 family)
MLALKVPKLTPAELDHAAAELLRDYSRWKGAPARPPIDVEEIAEQHLRLTLELDDLRARLGLPDVLGATWFEEKLIRIEQTLEGKEGRLAFTVAHELGHWQLHRALYLVDKQTLPLFPAKEGAAPKSVYVCRNGERDAPAEWQANQFAARLLMPGSFVKKVARGIHGEDPLLLPGLNEARAGGGLPEALRAAAAEVIRAGEFSNASNEAMCYRLLDLGLVVDARQAQRRLL